ncbi:hypothetical protein E2C01_012574 [Portunus trituberculatus]|uniref:Uncharacterized protein n=1 Tax=Portunus trituberculatus TaxID=210409 RepID=A0A5B7DE87_PORTR|nr:hypothetical protein [Portunus trituberculatus]
MVLGSKPGTSHTTTKQPRPSLIKTNQNKPIPLISQPVLVLELHLHFLLLKKRKKRKIEKNREVRDGNFGVGDNCYDPQTINMI